MPDKASVIIPVYNGYKWADGVVSSISGNINEVGELILVNDGEAQDFANMIETLRSKLNVPVITIHTSGLQGPAIARNLGIDKAECEFIAFLDCDDIWLPTSLKKRIDLLVKTPQSPFAYCSWQYISELGRPLNIYHVPDTTTIDQLLVTNYLALPSVVIRRDYLGNKRFPNVGHEDYGFWLDLLNQSSTHAVGVSDVGLQVRIVTGSTSSNKNRALRWHWAVLKNFGVPVPIRVPLFFGYAVNAVLKRKFRFSHPVFFGLDRLTKSWLSRRFI